MPTNLVAIDAHKRTCTAVVFEDWNPVGNPVRFASTRENLRDLAKKNPTARFALEACSVQEWMIDTLRAAGVTADAYTPPKKESKGRKSDPLDALRLGRKVLLEDVNVVRVPTPEERRMRDRVRQRQYLVAERTRFINRIRHALNRSGVRLAGEDPEEEDTEEADGKTHSVLQPEGRRQVLKALPDLADDYAVLDVLTQRRKALDKELRNVGKDIPEVRILQSIPGFGPVISLAFHVETGPVTRFAKASRLVNYYGLDPTGHQSGDTYVDHHQISRKGRSYLRGLMTQAAWVHVRWCPDGDVAQKYRRLAQERGKLKGEAITAVAAHLVRVAWTLLTEKREFTLNRPARTENAGTA
jgi:transposase